MALIRKKFYFDLLFTFFSQQGKVTKILSAHISLAYIHVFCLIFFFFFFCLTNFEKKIRIYQVWFLFGMIPGVDSYSRHFGTINKKTKLWAKLKLACLLLICIYTNAKFIVICKLLTLNDGRWRLSSIQKTQKALLLSSSHFAFYQ